MNTLAKILLGTTSVALLTFTGCKKLDETPYDFYAPENVYKTADDAEAAIAGVYSDFNSYDWFAKPYWEWLCEDEDHTTGASFSFNDIGSGNYDGNYKTPKMFEGPYIVIARANSVLERIPAITMDATQKNRILGEARFLRAFSYFVLVRLHGPVPLRTSSLSSITDTNLPRASVADVYAQIIDDLKKAEDLMPYQGEAGSGALGHANKGAAQALLAKVYATIGSASLKNATVNVRSVKDGVSYPYVKDVVAGYEGFDSNQYYQLAKDEAGKLINSGKYSLFANYMDMWKKSSDNMTEHIFMIQTLKGSIVHGNYVSSYFTQGDLGGRGYMWMDVGFYNQFQPTDERVDKGVSHIWYEDYGQGKFYRYFPRADSAKYRVVSILPLTPAHPVRLKGDTTFAYYSPKPQILKYYVPGKLAAPLNIESLDPTNYPMLRYSDVLLTYAEAENELNGNTADARRYFVQVRRRSNQTATVAQDPLLDPVSLSRQEMRSYILAERAQELYSESNRRFDLVRWGIFLPVMSQLGIRQSINKVRTQKHLLLPLSPNEISANRTIQQNFGW